MILAKEKGSLHTGMGQDFQGLLLKVESMVGERTSIKMAPSIQETGLKTI